MESPFEGLQISVTGDEVRITLHGDNESISFGGVAPLTEESSDVATQFYRLQPAERPEEYVVTFEFHWERLESTMNLARLDAHLREVRLRVHDDGYILEGLLTSWIGYTEAVRSHSG
ncbi:MAG: hypothetical protein ACOC45_00425 [Alkalispirochaetaceae bacterium]